MTTGNYPNNGPEDGELTDPEVRRLIYDVVRERFMIVSNTHLADYLRAKSDHEKPEDPKQPAAPRVPRGPLPAYDPVELSVIYDALVAQARKEVLAIRGLSLSD